MSARDRCYFGVFRCGAPRRLMRSPSENGSLVPPYFLVQMVLTKGSGIDKSTPAHRVKISFLNRTRSLRVRSPARRPGSSPQTEPFSIPSIHVSGPGAPAENRRVREWRSRLLQGRGPCVTARRRVLPTKQSSSWLGEIAPVESHGRPPRALGGVGLKSAYPETSRAD